MLKSCCLRVTIVDAVPCKVANEATQCLVGAVIDGRSVWCGRVM